MANGAILTAEQERKLRQPIDEYVGKIQKEIDELREHGTAEVIEYQNLIANVKRDKTLSKGEKESEIKEFEAKLSQAKAVEAQNKDKVAKLISDAESYLKENFEKLYYNAVKESCEAEKAKALEDHKQRLAQLEKEHKEALAGMSDQVEIKEENYVHKNRISNEKLELEKEKQRIKDRKHDAFTYKYHLIDLLRLSEFTFAEEVAQKWENYKYTFNRRSFPRRRPDSSARNGGSRFQRVHKCLSACESHFPRRRLRLRFLCQLCAARGLDGQSRNRRRFRFPFGLLRRNGYAQAYS